MQAVSVSAVELSVVAPLHDEEANVAALIRRVIAAAEPLVTAPAGLELVLVDDGSRDRTWALIAEHARADPRVRGVRLATNAGQFQANLAGLSQARGAAIVVMDGDLQERPEDIPALYAAVQAGADLALGRKRRRNQPPLQTAVTEGFYLALNALLDEPYDPGVGNFRALSARNRDWILAHGERSWLLGLMGDPGLPRATVDIEHAPRGGGRTSYSWAGRVRMGLAGLKIAARRRLLGPGPPSAPTFEIGERTWAP